MTPAVAGETVFVGSCSGTYFALDLHTGEVRWTYDAKGVAGPLQFHGDPVITNDLVVTGSDSGTPSYTFALDRVSGDVRWKREGASLESDLVQVGSNVVGRTWNGDLVALSVQNGDVVWRHSPSEYLYQQGPDMSFAERNGVLYVGGVDGWMYAVDGATGATRWKTDLGSQTTTSPVLDDTAIFVGAGDHSLVRLSQANGEVEARMDVSSRLIGRPALAGDVLLCLSGRTEILGIAKSLDGVVWSQPTAEEWSSLQPLLWQGTVVVGNKSGEVFGYRVTDGAVMWSSVVGGVVRGLGAADGTVLVGTLAGTLYAIQPVPREAAER